MVDNKVTIIEDKNKLEDKAKCGIIMPISSIDWYSAEHRKEVSEIISDAIADAWFCPNIVSNADEVWIIQRAIVQNIYNNPIIVCDVSWKNPNVMFELWMRLAFDKPTIIIKDDQTSYSFDTGIIEHLEYPKDLRFQKILDFKKNLKEKIEATYKKASKDPNYTTFLKHFKELRIAHIPQEEVTTEKYMLQSIDDLRNDVRQLIKSNRLKNTDIDSPREGSRITNEAVKIIEKNANDYLKINGFQDYLQVLKAGKKDDLIRYLEKIEEVREKCENFNTFQKILDIFIFSWVK